MNRIPRIGAIGVLVLFCVGCSGSGLPGESAEDRKSEGASRAAPLAASDPAILASQPVGRLAGSKAVSADGSATYTVPLEIPAGRGGVQPALSLTYSSRGGNGLLGVGWQLSEGSAITPCGSTMRRDGETRPVQLTSKDHLCLDGARLVPVSGSTTEYRTEPDTGTRILAVSSDSIGVLQWAVYLKSGLIARYGSTADSRVEAYKTVYAADLSGTSTNRRIAWLRSQVEDRVGNYIRYEYDRTPAAGAWTAQVEWSLRRISYGGFLPTGASPTRWIDFTYDTSRTDSIARYYSGIRVNTTRRLTRIAMNAPAASGAAATLVRSYNLGYEMGALSHRSRLATIAECDGAGVCLPLTRLKYTDPSPQFVYHDLGAAAIRDRASSRFFAATDVNGDGMDDLVYRDTNGQISDGGDRIAVRLSTGSTLAGAQYSPAVTMMRTPDEAYTTVAHPLTALMDYDLDQDGKVDLLGVYNIPFCCDASGAETTCSEKSSECSRKDAYEFRFDGSAFVSAGLTTAPENLVRVADGTGDLWPDFIGRATYKTSGYSYQGEVWEIGSTDVQRSAAYLALNRCAGKPVCTSVHPELGRLQDIDGDGTQDLLLPYVATGVLSSGVPVAPTGVTATWNLGHVVLTWNAVSGASDYHVYSGTSSGNYSWNWNVGSSTTSRGTVLSIWDQGTSPDRTFYYVIKAVNAYGESIATAEVVSPNVGPPASPAGVVAIGTGAVTLRWKTVPGASDYHIYSGVSSGSYQWDWYPGGAVTYGGGSASYSDPGTQAGTTYYYRIKSMNSYGESVWSDEVMATAGTNSAAPPLVPPDYPVAPGTLRYDILQIRGNQVEAFPSNLQSAYDVHDWVEFRALDLACSVFADVNGDGLADQVSVKNGATVRLNKGDGTFDAETAWISSVDFPGLASCSESDKDAGVRVVDYNQDGLADLVILGKTVSAAENAVVLESNGKGFVKRTLPIELGSATGDAYAAAILDFNGDGLFDVVQLKGTSLELFEQRGGHADLLDHVEESEGIQTWGVTYAPLLQTGYTRPTTGCTDPVRCYLGFMLVVRDELEPDSGSTASLPAQGASLRAVRRHAYAGGRIDRLGDGWVGFERHTVTNLFTGAVDQTTFDQSRTTYGGVNRYHFKGLPIEQLTWASVGAGTIKAKRTVTTYAVAGSPYFVYPSQVVETDYESTSFNPSNPSATTPLRSTTTTTTKDAYQNVTRMVVDRGGGTVTTVDRTYTIDTANWLTGLLTQETTSATVAGATGTRTTQLVYEPDATGRVRDTIREPNGSSDVKRCTHVAARNTWGLPTREETTPGGCASTSATRATTMAYDADGTFAVSTANALGQTASRVMHPGLGLAMSDTDANLLKTTRQFDGFGRLRKTSAPDGSWSTLDYAVCAAPFNGMCVTTRTSTGGYAVAWSDRLGQAVRAETLAGDGKTPIYSDVDFNIYGQVSAKKLPYFKSSASYYLVRNSYDNLGRLISACPLTGNTNCKHTTYSGLSTTSFDEDNKQRTSTLGVNGLLASTAITGSKVTTRFSYAPFDLVQTVTDPSGNAVSFEYDVIGRKTRELDKDTGERRYKYNAFDELVTETDAKGAVTTYSYDALGRMTSRSASDGIDQWVWDTAAGAGKGRLRSQTRGSVTTTFGYDSIGRPTTEAWQIDGVTYTHGYAYDALGRLWTHTFPAVTGRASFVVENVFDSTGRLESLRDLTAPASPKVLWTANSRNAMDAVTKETLGNKRVTSRTYFPETGRLQGVSTPGIHDVSYVYNANGDLASRTDSLNSATAAAVTHTETFTYDDADRLATATVAGRATPSFGYAYDALGNLAAATDGACTGMMYGGTGFGPHQLARATCNGITIAHTYDANGNETLTSAPDYREQTWTSFNKVAEVHTRYGRMKYTYDASHRRVKKERIDGALSFANTPLSPALNDSASGVWDTVRYAGPGYERREISGSSAIEHVFTVAAEGRPVAALTYRQVGSTGTDDYRYYHTDFQGTVERTTDGTGALKEVTSFDAWGVRRNPDWTASTPAAVPASTRIGYTGQEQDDETGSVIDMGGRTYDPYFKRFTSPDTVVQAPTFGPSWNRYSYVFNNPLRYTDPTGHEAVAFENEASFWDFFTAAVESGGTLTTGLREMAQLDSQGRIHIRLKNGGTVQAWSGGAALATDGSVTTRIDKSTTVTYSRMGTTIGVAVTTVVEDGLEQVHFIKYRSIDVAADSNPTMPFLSNATAFYSMVQNARDHARHQALLQALPVAAHFAYYSTLLAMNFAFPFAKSAALREEIKAAESGIVAVYANGGAKTAVAATTSGAASMVPRIAPGSLPPAEEASLMRTVNQIDAGTIPTGPLAAKWGTPFRNWNNDLPGPSGAASPYLEYRVAPLPGMSGAGPLRVVGDQRTGEMFYTWTHYGDGGLPAFVQIR